MADAKAALAAARKELRTIKAKEAAKAKAAARHWCLHPQVEHTVMLIYALLNPPCQGTGCNISIKGCHVE